MFDQTLGASQINTLYQAGAGIFYDVALAPQWAGGHLQFSWPGGGKLMQADRLDGPWTKVNSATSPYSVTATESQKFFRIQVQ